MPRQVEDLTKEQWIEKAEHHRQMLIFALNLLQDNSLERVDSIRKILWRYLMLNNPHYSSISNEFDVLDMGKWLDKLKVKVVHCSFICSSCEQGCHYLFDDGKCHQCMEMTPEQMRGD